MRKRVGGPYLQFVKVYTEQEKKTMWICKPADSSRGQGTHFHACRTRLLLLRGGLGYPRFS